MPPGADVTVAARHPLRTFHRLAQLPHGARHGRPDGLRRHAVPVFETGKETFRRLPDRSRSRHSGLRPRIHDGREGGDQQKEEYEDRCFHSVRKYPYHKFSTNPEDKQVRGGFLSIHFRPEVGRSRSPPPTGHAGQPDGHKKGREIPARKVWTASTCAP